MIGSMPKERQDGVEVKSLVANLTAAKQFAAQRVVVP
jgi:hypothetical protein